MTRHFDLDLQQGGEIEMAFIRTLSVRGLILSGEISNEDKRERIRVAILEQKLALEKFSEELTFSQAYQQCYHLPLDLRQGNRRRGEAAAG